MLTPKQLEQMEYDAFSHVLAMRMQYRIGVPNREEYRLARQTWLDATTALELDTAARARMAPNKEGTC